MGAVMLSSMGTAGHLTGVHVPSAVVGASPSACPQGGLKQALKEVNTDLALLLCKDANG